MDVASAAGRFRRDGFLVVDGFFAPSTMAGLERRIVDHFGPTPALLHDENFTAGAEVEVVPWFPVREGVTDFDPIETDPDLQVLTDALLGAGWTSQYCMVMFSAADSVGQAWHQDCPPENPRAFNLNRLVYPSDIDPGVGGQLVVVPGSHRRGEMPPGSPHADLPGQVVITPNAGTLVMVHGHLWHRVTAVAGSARWSINFRAGPLGVDPGVTDVCVYRTMRYRFSTGEVLSRR